MVQYLFIDEKAVGSKPTILLSISRAANRKLIRKIIPEQYHVIDGPDSFPANTQFDLCITDLPTFQLHKAELLNKKNEAQPVYLPFLLLVEDNRVLKTNPAVWDIFDDIIEVPVPMKILSLRIKNQLRSRQNSLKIARQNNKLRILEKAIHSTEVGISITDEQKEDSPIIFCNDGFVKLTGYSRDEIIGKNCRFLQNDDRDQPAIKKIHSFTENGTAGCAILRNYKKDGSMFWNELSMAPIKDNNGEVTHFVGIQNNVTQLVETQQQLEEEKNLHQLIASNSTDMISRHSLDGTYLYVSPSCKQVLGYHPEDLIGKDAFEYFHPEDIKKVKAAHKELKERKQTKPITYRKKTKSGKYKWVETITRISFNSKDKSLVELQSSTRDITERKKYEYDLEESLHEKNVLLQEIHHRVKNNLAVISGLLQIQQFETNDETLNKILGNSVSRIKSMALIHEKLYRSKSLSHVKFDEYINGLISTILNSHDYYNDKIKIDLECDGIVLNVNQAVPCALILNEIISNAIEHAFVGRDQGTIWVSFKEVDGQILASVKDNGIGIPEDLMESKRQSMGLTIIRTLIKQLNSKLEVKTEDGTEFCFTFSLKDMKGAHSRFI
ncbi:MAG: PAS domain S-box protein [Gracilimonas sp.]|uniref:PAS domain S-box protein n=1 Tax=Gracilimonas sp. TaxID=1974203 RepID=UPI0019AC6101|nr:PAS domain S-box protein [Gracilimonas sp.]MBD3615213.1 PAS domain S-box protein [Gracilimonas sp.]